MKKYWNFLCKYPLIMTGTMLSLMFFEVITLAVIFNLEVKWDFAIPVLFIILLFYIYKIVRFRKYLRRIEKNGY